MSNPAINDVVTAGPIRGTVVGLEDWDGSKHGTGPVRRVLTVRTGDGQWHRVPADQVTECQPYPLRSSLQRLVSQYGRAAVLDVLGV